MKKIILAILLMPLTLAVGINTIYYNPYTEAGSEFILLENNLNKTVNLTGWTIATPTSNKDATLAGMINPNEKFLIADKGWNNSKDNSTWPDANYEETLTLPNSGGFVRLVDDKGSIIDEVSYDGIIEGEALVRINNTGDGNIDFITKKPVFIEEVFDEKDTTIEISVENVPPQIVSWDFQDDDEKEGVQIVPLPGSTRNVNVKVNVTDNNTLENVVVRVNDIELLKTNQTFSGTIPITMEDEEIIIFVEDEEHSVEEKIPIEFLPITNLKIPSKISLELKPGQNKNISLKIENTGTTNMDVMIKGIKPVYNNNIIDYIKYTLLGKSYLLNEEFTQHRINLRPRDQTEINLQVKAGKIPAGKYKGQILIASVAK